MQNDTTRPKPKPYEPQKTNHNPNTSTNPKPKIHNPPKKLGPAT